MISYVWYNIIVYVKNVADQIMQINYYYVMIVIWVIILFVYHHQLLIYLMANGIVAHVMHDAITLLGMYTLSLIVSHNTVTHTRAQIVVNV
jgi:hypothetical protein